MRFVKQKDQKISYLAKRHSREGPNVDKKRHFYQWQGHRKMEITSNDNELEISSMIIAFLKFPDTLLSTQHADGTHFHKVVSQAMM
eukprot:12570057-Ditylum_brightwellii.AAC.1